VETHTEIGIDKIELKIDNEVKYSSNEDYITYSWYYNEATIGFHEIEAIAYDIIGQKATASVKAFFFLF
ncbi:MAG: hypothetical protein DRN11_04200, partial [Thermoplasmata archaeon]